MKGEEVSNVLALISFEPEEAHETDKEVKITKSKAKIFFDMGGCKAREAKIAKRFFRNERSVLCLFKRDENYSMSMASP